MEAMKKKAEESKNEEVVEDLDLDIDVEMDVDVEIEEKN